MDAKPTYNDLENRIEQLERQLEVEKLKNNNESYFQLLLKTVPITIFLTSELHSKVDYII